MHALSVTLTQRLRHCLPRAIWAQALAIQLLCLLAWSGFLYGVHDSHGWLALQQLAGPTVFSALLCAAYLLTISLLTIYWRLPVWWRWIQPLFVIAVAVLQQVEIGSQVYLAGFLLTSLVFWTVHQTRVPFFPSFPATWQALTHLLDQHAGLRPLQVLEIGSGLGDVAMALVGARPQDHVTGIEIAPLPWAISWCRGRFRHSAARFWLGDYRKHDFCQQDVVFAYLSPAVMPAVWHKARQQMRPGSLFISSEFPVPEVAFTHCIQPAKGAPALYVYQLA